MDVRTSSSAYGQRGERSADGWIDRAAKLAPKDKYVSVVHAPRGERNPG